MFKQYQAIATVLIGEMTTFLNNLKVFVNKYVQFILENGTLKIRNKVFEEEEILGMVWGV